MADVKVIWVGKNSDLAVVVADVSGTDGIDSVVEADGSAKQKAKLVMTMVPQECMEQCLHKLQPVCDAVVPLKSDDKAEEAAKYAACLRLIVDNEGLMCLDLDDLASILSDDKIANAGYGEASGDKAIFDATILAFGDLPGDYKEKPANFMIFMTEKKASLPDVQAVLEHISSQVNQDSNIIYGFYDNNKLSEGAVVFILATKCQ